LKLYQGIEVDLLTPRFYSASNYDDLELVVKHIKSNYPDYAIFAIGISYGGFFGRFDTFKLKRQF
jgi:predicted alpha/beta-fold hydrolase